MKEAYLHAFFIVAMATAYVAFLWLAQLAGAAEYTNCISAKGEDSHNECPRYETKQSDDEAPVMQ